jgi:hypothetical protein
MLITVFVYAEITNSVALSPQAKYTDWATAICRRNLVPTFAARRVSRGQRRGSHTAVNLSFLDRSRYFCFQVALHLSSRGWLDHVPDPLLLRKSGSVGNRTRDHWVCRQELWPLDHAEIYTNNSCGGVTKLEKINVRRHPNCSGLLIVQTSV